MASWVLVGGLIAAGVVGLLAVLGRSLRRLQARRLEEALERYGPGRVVLVEPSANFFGQRSKGMGQVRGNGVLLLLRGEATGGAESDGVREAGEPTGELVFEMWVPQRTLRVPLDRLRGVEVVRSFLGKSKGVRLVKVTFVNDAGAEDAAAWYLRDRDAWLPALRAQVTI